MKNIKEYEKLQLQTNDLNSVENFNLMSRKMKSVQFVKSLQQIRPGGEIKMEEPIINEAEEELNIDYQVCVLVVYNINRGYLNYYIHGIH